MAVPELLDRSRERGWQLWLELHRRQHRDGHRDDAEVGVDAVHAHAARPPLHVRGGLLEAHVEPTRERKRQPVGAASDAKTAGMAARTDLPAGRRKSSDRYSGSTPYDVAELVT